MRADSEGFLYPETDASRCIGCGLCERVCPVIGAPERVAAATGTPLGTLRRGLAKDFLDEPKVFAARCASDELRMASASGGAFTVLAERVIRRGGVVFGARWNEDFTEVFHAWTETLDGLAAFRGSKYLQSRIGNAFAKTREFLRAGREVMFTGTPCQIAGLRRALRRDFPNLLAVDIACHSVPSPSVWRAFFSGLRERAGIGVPVTNVLFRKKVFDARRGTWNCSTLAVETAAGTVFSAPLYSTPFGKGFGSGLFSRPSCHECPAKNRTSGSDVTLGDFWGAEKYFPDLKTAEGLSVVVCNTARGIAAFDEARSAFDVLREASWAQAVPANGGLRNETHRHPKREEFFAEFLGAGTPERAADAIRKFTKTPFPRRVRAFAFRCARFALARTGTLPLAKKLFNTKNHEEQNTDITGTIHQLLRAFLPRALLPNPRAILRRLRALAEKRDKTSTPPPIWAEGFFGFLDADFGRRFVLGI